MRPLGGGGTCLYDQKEEPLCRRKEVVLPVFHGEKQEIFCCLDPGRNVDPGAAAKGILTECVPWAGEAHAYTHQKEEPLCRRKEVVLPVPHGEKREMFCCLGPGRNAGPSAAAKGILKRSKSLERMGRSPP